MKTKRVRKAKPRPCIDCDGTGRCSDPWCWCLTDVCAFCKGRGWVL